MNFDMREPVLIIFVRRYTEKVSNKRFLFSQLKGLYFPSNMRVKSMKIG